MRKWRPPDAKADEEWQVVHQIVVPQVYRQEIIKLAYDTPMAGNLGVKRKASRFYIIFIGLDSAHMTVNQLSL